MYPVASHGTKLPSGFWPSRLSYALRSSSSTLPHPHQLSGGLRQRVLIGTAIAGGASLLIADEPTTALDMTVQRQILALLRTRRDAGDTLLLISHDLAVVDALPSLPKRTPHAVLA